MKSRINEDRYLAHIYVVLKVHTEHRRDPFLDSALTVDHLDHRRVEPDTVSSAGNVNALVACLALTDYGSSCDVTRFERVHEGFTFRVDEHSSDRTYLFGNKSSVDLRGISNAGRVILKRVGIEQGSTDTVGEHESVSRCTVVVRGREALIVHTPGTAGGYNDRLCLCNEEVMSFHIHKDSTGCLAVFIKNYFNGRCEINYGNAAVYDLVAENSHYFGSGVVLCRVHTLSRCSAAVSCYHRSVWLLVKENSEVV